MLIQREAGVGRNAVGAVASARWMLGGVMRTAWRVQELGISDARMATVSLNPGLGDREWLQAVADHFEPSNVALAATSLTLTWAAVREGNPHDLIATLLASHDSPADPRRELPGKERMNLAAFKSLLRDGFVVRAADGWLLRIP